MANELYCRNMPCPQPVLRVREYIATNNPDTLTVIVDNTAACENVTRFLQSRGYGVTPEQQGGLWRLAASRAGGAPAHLPGEGGDIAPGPAAEGKILVVIPSNVFGSGDDELGGKLMQNFLRTLPEMGTSLWRIILLNGGVKLSAAGSPVLAELRVLEKQGVSVLVCGSCLDFFGLLERKQVGETTNMLDVVTSMQIADKVLRI